MDGQTREKWVLCLWDENVWLFSGGCCWSFEFEAFCAKIIYQEPLSSEMFGVEKKIVQLRMELSGDKAHGFKQIAYCFWGAGWWGLKSNFEILLKDRAWNVIFFTCFGSILHVPISVQASWISGLNEWPKMFKIFKSNVQISVWPAWWFHIWNNLNISLVQITWKSWLKWVFMLSENPDQISISNQV